MYNKEPMLALIAYRDYTERLVDIDELCSKLQISRGELLRSIVNLAVSELSGTDSVTPETLKILLDTIGKVTRETILSGVFEDGRYNYQG